MGELHIAIIDSRSPDCLGERKEGSGYGYGAGCRIRSSGGTACCICREGHTDNEKSARAICLRRPQGSMTGVHCSLWQ